ncbi:sugar phosphorylase [Lactococcus garvieae]|uniref:sugar phosphorylase n=1 Tax=Lactococcus garvieae TaxID=1363 RepID=UPI001F61646A|nr:sugar phosphorylase [Lactococcus garvieae]MCI3859503.1 sugar phosphorylase [Lactococcus garvieae]
MNVKIKEKLILLYGERADEAEKELEKVLNKFAQRDFPQKEKINEKNAYLIAYGDSILREGQTPLATLNEVLSETIAGAITDVHLLPMFPFTSDDGFSVTDYYKINPQYGTWEDIEHLSKNYRLMFDFVANHMSKDSEWFQSFLQEEEDFKEAFVIFDEEFDASNTVRPRTSPLFHNYKGKKVWTTFSEDQVDVNIKDPKMFARLTEVLLTYASKGAASIRLDAIGFLWKESGSRSIHLWQTHEVIKIWRKLLEELSPNTQIITETNVPHEENISYFGKNDEANQVYQFPLPPLVLHSFTVGDAQKLSAWAKGIEGRGDTETYFNFLASHDGIGMRPTEGILSDVERNNLVEKVIENGGEISYKENTDGSRSVYELNINYSEALRNKGETDEIAVEKMKAAHSILFSVIGVPAIYYHSLFGSRNDYKGVLDSGINRRINREKLSAERLLDELKSDSYRNGIYTGLKKMLEKRAQYKAFSPYGKQEILDIDKRVFAVKRTHLNQGIISITNVSNQKVTLYGLEGMDIIKEKTIPKQMELEPYAYIWCYNNTNK